MEEELLEQWKKQDWVWVNENLLLRALDILNQNNVSPLGYVLKKSASGWFIHKLY